MNRMVFALATVLSAGFSAALGGAPQRHAVIIGINDYADAAIPDLKYAESDARNVYDTLTDPAVGKFRKENVTLLLGEQGTPSTIKAALYKLRGVDKNDLVIIFYSGHGAKEGDEAFWVTQNAEAKALPATALGNSDIRKFLAQVPSEKLVVLLDCCYAASTVKKSLGDPAKLFGDFTGKGRVTIAGAADNQEALEYPDKKSGVFTYHLVAGLRGAADLNRDGVVTFEEVWEYLGNNVRKASAKQGGLHEPVIITEQGVTPHFLLTFNPSVQSAAKDSLSALSKLLKADRITGAQYRLGLKALSEPAIAPPERARREVFMDLAGGKLDPKYLGAALRDALAKVAAQQPSGPVAGGKPTLAVVPFQVLGDLNVKDAGAILAERLLPYFAAKYQIIDQMQLRRFLDQDRLTMAELAELAQPAAPTKSLSKAVKLRAVGVLVVGSISSAPDGLTITARLSDWQTGKIENSRIAQITGDNWGDLLKYLPLLGAKLSGSLTDIGPPPEVVLPPLPGGLDTIEARVQQLEAINAEIAKSLKTMTENNPKVVFLRSSLMKLAIPLINDTRNKIDELKATDLKLADNFKPNDPKRQAIASQLANLQKGMELLGRLEAEKLKADKKRVEEICQQAKSQMAESHWLLARQAVRSAIAILPNDAAALALQDDIGKHIGPGDIEWSEIVTRKLSVATPKGEEAREIAYYLNSIGMQFVYLWPGKFAMGSPDTEAERDDDEKRHEVRISAGFYIAVAPVTQEQYRAITGMNPSKFEGASNPVDSVSWKDAVEYSKTLSAKDKKAYLLPTEAQWEYACRAGTSTPFYTGNALAPAQANFDTNFTYGNSSKSAEAYTARTSKVVAFLPNAWGLHDMHGNVSEWCMPPAVTASTTRPGNSIALTKRSNAVRPLRGGSWFDPPARCRSAAIAEDYLDSAKPTYGFRVLIAVPPGSGQ